MPADYALFAHCFGMRHRPAGPQQLPPAAAARTHSGLARRPELAGVHRPSLPGEIGRLEPVASPAEADSVAGDGMRVRRWQVAGGRKRLLTDAAPISGAANSVSARSASDISATPGVVARHHVGSAIPRQMQAGSACPALHRQRAKPWRISAPCTASYTSTAGTGGSGIARPRRLGRTNLKSSVTG